MVCLGTERFSGVRFAAVWVFMGLEEHGIFDIGRLRWFRVFRFRASGFRAFGFRVYGFRASGFRIYGLRADRFRAYGSLSLLFLFLLHYR